MLHHLTSNVGLVLLKCTTPYGFPALISLVVVSVIELESINFCVLHSLNPFSFYANSYRHAFLWVKRGHFNLELKNNFNVSCSQWSDVNYMCTYKIYHKYSSKWYSMLNVKCHCLIKVFDKVPCCITIQVGNIFYQQSRRSSDFAIFPNVPCDTSIQEGSVLYQYSRKYRVI